MPGAIGTQEKSTLPYSIGYTEKLKRCERARIKVWNVPSHRASHQFKHVLTELTHHSAQSPACRRTTTDKFKHSITCAGRARSLYVCHAPRAAGHNTPRAPRTARHGGHHGRSTYARYLPPQHTSRTTRLPHTHIDSPQHLRPGDARTRHSGCHPYVDVALARHPRSQDATVAPHLATIAIEPPVGDRCPFWRPVSRRRAMRDAMDWSQQPGPAIADVCSKYQPPLPKGIPKAVTRTAPHTALTPGMAGSLTHSHSASHSFTTSRA
jgi:hypothetical protein